MSFWDTLISVGGNLLGNAMQDDGEEEAAARRIQGNEEAAGILEGGYRDSLAQYLLGNKDVRNALGIRLGNAEDALLGSAEDFAGQQFDIADMAAWFRQVGMDHYADILEQGGDEANQLLADVTDDAGNLIDLGTEDYADLMGEALAGADEHTLAGHDDAVARPEPFMEGGDAALAQLREDAALDPGVLSEAQRIALDDQNRDSAAKLAASGLRGAGRAGVASMMDADARARARLEEQNRARRDAATGKLASMGYGATGSAAGMDVNTGNALARNIMAILPAVAGRVSGAADRKAGMRMNTAGVQAGNIVNTAGRIGAQNDQSINAILNYMREAGLATAGNDRQIAQQLAQMGWTTDTALADSLGSDRDLVGDTIRNIAGARAGAKADAGYVASNQQLAAAQRRGRSLGAVSGYIADTMKRENLGLPSATPNYSMGDAWNAVPEVEDFKPDLDLEYLNDDAA